MRRGFSLIELLMVITIVSLLTAVTLMNARFVLNWVFDLLGHP